MAPTINPTDAPVVSVKTLTTPPSTVTTGHTVPVEQTSMYFHFLPHCVFSDHRYYFNLYLRQLLQHHILYIHSADNPHHVKLNIITIHRWVPLT